jgi:hypothetical protein
VVPCPKVDLIHIFRHADRRFFLTIIRPALAAAILITACTFENLEIGYQQKVTRSMPIPLSRHK